MKIKHIFILMYFFAAQLYTQEITWSPLFPAADDTLTIIYDASSGSGALAGEQNIYIHTGVITELSEHENYWRHVKTSWGQNTAETKMNKLGEDRWSISFHIKSFYDVPETETIQRIAFVFRNASGSKTGKAEDESDFFISIFSPGLNVSFIQPEQNFIFASEGDTIRILAVSNDSEILTLYRDQQVLDTTNSDTLAYIEIAGEPGKYSYAIIAEDSLGFTQSDYFSLLVENGVTIAAKPSGWKDGVNFLSGTSVGLVMPAPEKESFYVIGSFSNWEPEPEYAMNRTPDRLRWWIQLDDLPPGSPLLYQYIVNHTIRTADPYARLVLDPWHDSDIPESIYPDIPEYPSGYTTGIVSVIPLNEQEFEWTDQDFVRPAKESLVIYELLIRDFFDEASYQNLIDTLDYFERLGINAIELMPVSEFEGNSSWGYNPSFYFAPDKIYGSANALKRFVNAAHSKGIAVILDMVLNHAFGQCPLVRLYWDSANNRPAPNNPWFNTVSPNPVYSWGYDFNHQSQFTRNFVDQVLAYWVEEFHFDGFRLDFTKGFTNTPGEGWPYDAQRIGILKRMGDALWSTDPELYIILEHFAENREEKELAEYGPGFLLWGNMNTAYSQSAMGYLNDENRRSDLSGGLFQTRGWQRPGLIAYMESHDEPWLMYKNKEYGRGQGNYNIKDIETGLDRLKLSAAFFLTLPGPKMLWQFGELGYDEELESGGWGRTAPKPVRWEYYEDPARKNVYDTYAALIKLRKSHPVFTSPQTIISHRIGQGQYNRRIQLDMDTVSVVILGNFNVASMLFNPDFPSAGFWYDYFAGDSLSVTDTSAGMELEAGEYKIYTSIPFEKPVITTIAAEEAAPQRFRLMQNYPNPFNPSTVIEYQLEKPSHVQLSIYNINGRHIQSLVHAKQSAGIYSILWNGLQKNGKPAPSGIYLYTLKTETQIITQKMIRLE